MLGTSFETLILAAATLLQTPAAPAGGAAPTKPPVAGAAAAGAPASSGDCRPHGTGPCCDPAIAQHLPRRAIFASCRETDETYLGEKGSKDTCRYVFKTAGAEGGSAFVEVYAPPTKQVPTEPGDPFFAWSKVGKAFVTTRAKSPRSAPMLAAATGIWLPGVGYTVSVNASTKVCTRSEAQKLAKLVK